MSSLSCGCTSYCSECSDVKGAQPSPIMLINLECNRAADMNIMFYLLFHGFVSAWWSGYKLCSNPFRIQGCRYEESNQKNICFMDVSMLFFFRIMQKNRCICHYFHVFKGSKRIYDQRLSCAYVRKRSNASYTQRDGICETS